VLLSDELLRVAGRVPVGHAEDGSILPGEQSLGPLEDRRLRQAWLAPGREQVHDHYLAAKGRQAEAGRGAESGQRNGGGGGRRAHAAGKPGIYRRVGALASDRECQEREQRSGREADRRWEQEPAHGYLGRLASAARMSFSTA